MIFSLIVACSFPLKVAAQNPPPQTIALKTVIDTVDAVLDRYQRNLGKGSPSLPPLRSAEFDFKTTTESTGGATLNLFFFKIGGSHEKDDVSEITYTYHAPAPPAGTGILLHRDVAPQPLDSALGRAIRDAAAAMKDANKAGGLPFAQLTISLAFGVQRTETGGANPTIFFVTAGLSGQKNRNDVQSVKLVFGSQ